MNEPVVCIGLVIFFISLDNRRISELVSLRDIPVREIPKQIQLGI
jgi:hypothetical protein